MLSKRYESTEVDRRTWLHVPSGTHWSTSSDTNQVDEIQKDHSLNVCPKVIYCSRIYFWRKKKTRYPLFYGDLVYKLRRVKGAANFVL